MRRCNNRGAFKRRQQRPGVKSWSDRKVRFAAPPITAYKLTADLTPLEPFPSAASATPTSTRCATSGAASYPLSTRSSQATRSSAVSPRSAQRSPSSSRATSPRSAAWSNRTVPARSALERGCVVSVWANYSGVPLSPAEGLSSKTFVPTVQSPGSSPGSVQVVENRRCGSSRSNVQVWELVPVFQTLQTFHLFAPFKPFSYLCRLHKRH